MARRSRKSLWTTSFQRALGAMTRTSLRAGNEALKLAVRSPVAGTRQMATLMSAVTGGTAGKVVAKGRRGTAGKGGTAVRGGGTAGRGKPGLEDCVKGMAFAAGGARRYYLYKPPGLRLAERLPLVVMLHGCAQDANDFALSTRMNRVAARERFLVLYPEQDRLANPQRCWNWYDTRSRQAYSEAGIVLAAIDQVCLLYPVDRERVALAGMSAGASMGALLATLHPHRFKAVVMHSGVPPGAANSAASAIGAMRGRRGPTALASAVALPPLLVIQGSNDRIVAPENGAAAAALWATAAGAEAIATRQFQRGARYPVTVTDFKSRGRLAARLCRVEGLAHNWSGGDAGQRHTDERGPDASRMVWAFILRQFKAALK